MLMLVVLISSFLSGSPDPRSLTKEQRQRELYRSMVQNQQKIKYHLSVIIRFVERMKNVRASSAREKAMDMDQFRMASQFLNRYHPGILDLMTKLKFQIEKNQADKKDVEKMIEELMAQLQRGIDELMQMLDTAVKSDQDASEDQS